MRFDEIQHQQRAISILRRALRSGRTHHAYLFDGPEGVGKERTARALATRLLCEADSLAPDADACGTCSACRLMAADNHPDYHLIHRGLHKSHPERTVRASKGLFLVVDLIRYFLIEPAGMKPTQGRKRVFVIRDAERMNEEAQNALLKTLEEPPGEACLILVTSSAARLLPTIRSRCQRVPFDPLPTDFVSAALKEHGPLSDADARRLAELADGRLGVALRWQQADLLDVRCAVAEIISGLDRSNPAAFAQQIVEQATTLALRTREGADAEVEAEDESGKRGSSKAPSTDEMRAGLKLVLMLIAAAYREWLAALVNGRAPDDVSLDQLDDCIQGVRSAEVALDRNVAPPLVAERLFAALNGDLPMVAL